MEKISEKLRAAAEAAITAGQSRHSIAKNARLDYPSFVRWLDEGRDIRLSTVDALAEYLGLELVAVEVAGEREPGEAAAAAPSKPTTAAVKAGARRGQEQEQRRARKSDKGK